MFRSAFRSALARVRLRLRCDLHLALAPRGCRLHRAGHVLSSMTPARPKQFIIHVPQREAINNSIQEDGSRIIRSTEVPKQEVSKQKEYPR